MTAAHHRHRLLAGLTRSRLLAVLRDSGGPIGIRELADAVGWRPTASASSRIPIGPPESRRTASSRDRVSPARRRWRWCAAVIACSLHGDSRKYQVLNPDA